MKVRVFAAIVGIGLASVAVAAEDSVTRYHLAAAAGNASKCSLLDPVFARLHTITVRNGDVEISSAGGIEGRMKEAWSGVYALVFELSGLRLDVVADLSSANRTLSVADRQLGCRWQAARE